ncbi:MAG TPA: DUF2934 domain-containing protein [Gammaproteobacteria bacterium]|nr:DUF2934 domain-containing protein [Gammaproteobacteria bacterium]
MLKTAILTLRKAAKSRKTTKPTVGKSNTTGYRIERKANKQRSSVSSAAFATERHRMIAEAAYYQAEKRGFQSGHALLDWLEAEKDVDRLLSKAANNIVTYM